jgi:hypothetical protein
MHCVTQDNLNGTACYGVHWRSWWRLSNVNPAGSAIFNNEVTITLSNNDIKIIQIILEQQLLKKNSDINQAGGVFVFKKIKAAIGESSL